MSTRLFVILGFFTFGFFSCKAELTGKAAKNKSGDEQPGEEDGDDAGGTEDSDCSKAAKLTSSDCIDPDLSSLNKGVNIMLCDGTISTGTQELPDLRNLTADKIVAGTTIGGVTGTYSSPTPDYPDAANVLADDTVNNSAGTMSNRGTWDMATLFQGSGYYNGISNTPVAGEYLTTTTINNQTGSIVDRTSWDMEFAFPGDGLYTSPTNVPAVSEVCDTTTFNGGSGSANCGAFQGNMGSYTHRTQGNLQLTLTEVHATAIGSVPAGQREIPVVATDDYGDPGLASVGVVTRTADAEWNVGSDRVVCGESAVSIDAKILDCDARHSVAVRPDFDTVPGDGKIRWDGAIHGNASEGSWTLVVVYSSSLAEAALCNGSCREVWRDDRTGLLWGDRIGGTATADWRGGFTWCEAAGNTQNDGGVDCTPGVDAGYNEWTNGSTYEGVSLCAESSTPLNGLTYPPLTPDGTGATADVGGVDTWDNSGSEVLDAKGGMKLSTTPEVRWRLPIGLRQ